MNRALLRSLAAVLALGVLAASNASAATPAQVAVEGVLYSAGGGAAADGAYDVTFSLYKDELAANPLWTEGPVKIGVKAGQWQYYLGSNKALGSAALNGQPWLGIQIGGDPELPRKQLLATAFAIRAAVSDGVECSGCIGAGQVDPKLFAGYAAKADLSAVAMSGNFSDLKGGPDLSGYAKKTDLSVYAMAADLANYVKAASLAAVAGSGSYNDLKDKPTMAKLNDKCGTGLVMIGIKADGSYDCTASAIAPDMIDEISNGLIFNQFVDSQAGTPDNVIPDGSGAGKSDSLDFPDIGVAQKIWIDIDLINSDVSKVKIELYGPGMVTPYVLYDGSKSGTALKYSFNKDLPIVTGDMDKDWVGKNLKGTWSITVKDPLKNQLNSTTDGKYNWSVNIQTLSSKKIQVKGNAIVDGNLTVGGNINLAANSKINANTNNFLPATYRWAAFNTYQENAEGWMAAAQGNGNGEPSFFGGITPQAWTDGNATAGSMSADKEVLRALFVNKGYAKWNATCWAEVFLMYSSTNSRVYLALFRVKNSTQNAIAWKPTFRYTSWSGWGEQASVAMNGSNVWTGDCGGGTCSAQPTINVPANRISTVIFHVTASAEYTWGYNLHVRKSLLAFYNNALKLDAGLEFVDDLDTATGGWEQ